ncbi:MAG TPA: ABC transporter ATP-binding protein [Brevundimonas sp.]|jgi:iron(III) transport system ATP-binding protein|uniref:ABC transporter ATP-binding protein n=1 Tax=Brevundimonas sp. TaxID=1871086 RepID=UPI002DEBCE2F|nr:ABC transporter ATP-binding protein [Brevundimonas sp.]
MNETATITARGVTRRYGPKTAVHGADVDLRAGRITCLLGPSGSGKSTLLRLIAGLEPVDAGEIRSGDRVLSATGRTVPPEARDVGLVFQDYALFPHLNVRDNVGFGLRHLPAADRKARVLKALTEVKLADREKSWPHALSGGEQQRVALARTLVREPHTVLLDEPFSGLDAHLKSEVRESLLTTLKTAGAAVLLVTHDAGEALMMADDLVLMDGGRVIQSGDPQACWARPASTAAARLLGEVNRLPAHVSNGVAQTPLGPAPAPGLPDGPAALLIRPQDLTPGADGLETTVETTRFGGHFSEVGARLGDDRVHLHVPGVIARPGDVVKIRADLSKATVVAD